MTVLLAALAAPALGQEGPPTGSRASLSVQLLEVVSFERGHVATLLAPGVSVIVPLRERWNLVAITSPIVGVDQTALGGVLVVTPQARIWQDGPWHASLGPASSVSRLYVREDDVWTGRTNLSAGVGLSVGRKGTVAQLGLDVSTAPTFDWALGVVPRLGLTAAL
ncbi:MAG: hypothetical protein KTR31_31025 [Myxococcales bacterium]|nr:hypothetical protein [Myxococcales bacterium]